MIARGKRPVFRRTDHEATDANFLEVQRVFSELAFPVTELLTLSTGNNLVVPTVTRPVGRITVYLDTAVTITDGGLDSSGRWLLVASGACKARFLFL